MVLELCVKDQDMSLIRWGPVLKVLGRPEVKGLSLGHGIRSFVGDPLGFLVSTQRQSPRESSETMESNLGGLGWVSTQVTLLSIQC